MTYGVQIFDSSGNLVWDSPTIAGGVIVDTRVYTAADTATLTYPDMAGRSVAVLGSAETPTTSGLGVTTDTSLGYPRVTVNANTGSGTRRLRVMVF